MRNTHDAYGIKCENTTVQTGGAAWNRKHNGGPMAELGKQRPQAKLMRLQNTSSAAFLGSHLRRKDEARRTRASRGESRRTLKVIGVEQTRSR